MATVSGPRFELVFATARASAERQVAEQQFEKTQAPEDALNLDFKRLSEYYSINQTQARSTFRWAKLSMFVGLATIVTGVWLFYFRPTQPDRFMSTVSTACGCVINLVSALYLRLHSQTQDRALSYYEPLARMQRLTLAIRLVDAHNDASERTQARNLVIRELLAGAREKNS
jgi:Co/Zn/Cd efflux system component